jgi:hypothetical protein
MKAYILVMERHYWISCVNVAWGRRLAVWLAGVRRAGKTDGPLPVRFETVEEFVVSWS